MARRTKLTKKIWNRIVEMVRSDTYTITEICEQCEITMRTWYNWRERNVDFDRAIEEAEEARMQELVKIAKKSLRRKVEGYAVDESRVVTIPSNKKDANGKPIPVIKEQRNTRRYIEPDTAAIIFTLTNGDPKNWRNRQTNEIVGKDGKDLFKDMSDDELDKRIKELELKINTE